MLVNTHIHTPFSFSSFDSVEQAVMLAKEEGVGVLGINDFNSLDGYAEFAEHCERYGIYPLFNIEFATLVDEDKLKGLRWNDINNPGVMNFCGKALNFPSSISGDYKNLLASIWKGSQDRIWTILSKVNDYLKSISLDITLEYHDVRNLFARQAVRERHLAKALYMAFVEKWNDPNILMAQFQRFFGDSNFNADLADAVHMQNEIRNRIFKPGKVAYVAEKPDSFIRLYEAKSFVLGAGGIPCYPLWLDTSGDYTEHEQEVAELAHSLFDEGIHAVEFISNRVSFDVLKKYVKYFYEKEFCISFGTEHCTPERYSLIPAARGGRPLDAELERITYEGACIYAAHQELHRQKRPGYIDENGKKLVPKSRMKDFMRIGDDIIRKSTEVNAKVRV